MSNCSGTACRSERATEPHLIDIAYAQSLPLVATNEPFFATPDDYESHDALICIAEGRLIAETDRRQLTPAALFQEPRRNGGACSPICRRRSRTRSRSRSAARIRPKTLQADPAALFTVGGVADEATELRERAEDGLERRLAAHGLAPDVTREDYRRSGSISSSMSSSA